MLFESPLKYSEYWKQISVISNEVNIGQGSRNEVLSTGQWTFFCEKNLEASNFHEYRHIIHQWTGN